MNILYLSCHAILEYDEIKLLAELGHTVHSIGSYTNPRSPGDPKRPPIIHPNLPVDNQHIDISNRYHQDNLHDEHLEWADLIIFMHDPMISDSKGGWILSQVEKFKRHNKPVVFRSIGQSSPTVELYLLQVKAELDKLFSVIRYSNNETYIASVNPIRPELYAPYISDALIPFYKDLSYVWDGLDHDLDILFVTQAATQRGIHCHFDELEAATANYSNRLLIGPNNDDWKSDTLKVNCPSYIELLHHYQTAKVFIYTGTIPASYTLAFLEAIAIGTPLLTISKEWWNKGHEGWINKNVFQVPELFPAQTYQNPEMLRVMLAMLMHDENIQYQISKNGRRIFEENFSKEKVTPLWKEFLSRF